MGVLILTQRAPLWCWIKLSGGAALDSVASGVVLGGWSVAEDVIG